MRKQKIIAFIALLCAAFPASAAEIRVSDFGAKPDDGKCDISAIRKAFAYAVANKATTVRFDAGVYDLNIGDATRDIFEIDGAENLSIVGAVGSDGEPKTVFLRRYKPKEISSAEKSSKCCALRIFRSGELRSTIFRAT